LGLALWKATRRLVLDRLEPLAEAVAQVGRGAVGTRVAVEGHDEIAAFAAGFNTMSARLEAADEALRAARDALEAILAAAPDGIRVIGPDFRVLHANDAHLAQLGLPREQVIGQPCHRLTHGAGEPCPPTLQTCPVVRILRQGGETLRFTDRHLAADGREMNVEVTAAPIRLPVDGATVDCVIEVIRDLDRAVEISHQQRLSEIALLANGVAHEINTPLSSILLALDTIRRDLPEGCEAHEFTNLIETEIQTCMDVSESLMRLSLPSSDTPQAVDLSAVARDTLRLVRPNLEQAGIEARAEVPAELMIEAPDSDMRILLLNLVVNAIHAMPGGGKLAVRAARDGSGVVLEVADTGVGIPPENLKDIFLPFWTRRPDGSAGRGLGL
ncbi:sensor histidine kinase, partial [Jhaorihella thermophila]